MSIKNPSILVIVISAPSKINRWNYEKEIWEKYANEGKKYNVDVVFTECHENFTIKTACKESYQPGIFQKTILTLKRYPNYDFYVRTNLSTFYIFKHLQYYIKKKLNNANIPMAGGWSLFTFFSGTGIVLNQLAKNLLVEQGTKPIHFDNANIPDDVLIGKILYTSNVQMQPDNHTNSFIYVYNNSLSYDATNMNLSFERQLRQIKRMKYPGIRLRLDNNENVYKEITARLLKHFYGKD
jgi:hypothetical protein